MKIIQTSNFLKKQSQFGSLPGDPSLPPGTTNQMIDEQFEGEEPKNYSKQSGEYETQVDWEVLTRELVNASYDVGSLPYFGRGYLSFYYEYDAEASNGEVTILDIRLLDIKTLMDKQYQPLTVSEPETKEAIFSGYKDEIVAQEKEIIREVSHEEPWGADGTEELH